jgi:hypothetical protein
MPRYVILEHDHPSLHWDLMMEAGEKLRTWRLAEMPRPGRRTEAVRIGDHRKMYLDYEGPVSGDRGKVTRWDVGVFELLVDDGERMEFRLRGDQLRGTAHMQRDEEANWYFILDPG